MKKQVEQSTSNSKFVKATDSDAEERYFFWVVIAVLLTFLLLHGEPDIIDGIVHQLMK